jgi:hypothetical protein
MTFPTMRNSRESSHRQRMKVTRVICGGGQRSALMILIPWEKKLYEVRISYVEGLAQWQSQSTASGGVSVPLVGVFPFIGGGEREEVVPVSHVGDGRPTTHQSGGDAVRHPVPCSRSGSCTARSV